MSRRSGYRLVAAAGDHIPRNAVSAQTATLVARPSTPNAHRSDGDRPPGADPGHQGRRELFRLRTLLSIERYVTRGRDSPSLCGPYFPAAPAGEAIAPQLLPQGCGVSFCGEALVPRAFPHPLNAPKTAVLHQHSAQTGLPPNRGNLMPQKYRSYDWGYWQNRNW